MRKTKIFTAIRARALFGSMLDNHLSKYSSEELEAMVQHLAESFAKDKANKEDGLLDSVKISEPPPRAS